MKDIPGYEKIYACDEIGNIYSLPRIIKKTNGWDKTFDWLLPLKQLRPITRKDGYLAVNLRKDSKNKSKLVHRLIAETFLSVPKDMDINHIDGDKNNNKLNNIEVCNRKENIDHALKLGLKNHKGSNHPQYFVDKAMREKIRMLLNTGMSQQEIAKIVGTHQTTISEIKLNKFPHREY